MRTQTIVNKMREYIQDFREQLAKEDLTSIRTLAENTGNFFRELMRELPQGGTLDREVDVFVGCVERFGTACGQNNLQQAAQELAAMEMVVETVKEQCAG